MNEAMPQIGDARFLCWVTPTEKVEAAAREKGWTPEGEFRADELVDPECYAESRIFSALDPAVQYGVEYIKAGHDWRGVVRVYRQEYATAEFAVQPLWLNRHKWFVSNVGVVVDHDISGTQA